MPHPQALSAVVERGLCTGCGLCRSMAGGEAIDMAVTSFGQMRPQFKRPLDRALEARILAACPGATVEGPATQAVPAHPVYGVMLSHERAWAADEAVRFRAAAGGVMTALGVHLLRSGEVEAILHVRAVPERPFHADAQISRTPEEVIAGAQSRYGPAAPLVHVMRLLDEGARFAVLAKPCDISAIRNLARQDPRVARQVPYLVTIFCGGIANDSTATKIAAYHGIAREDVRVFRWRGNGWPGPTRIEARDGRAFDLTYEQTYFDTSKPWTYNLPFRCKICPDAVGEAADIAVPDGWMIEDGKRIFREAPGVNIAVVRTEAGARLMADAVKAGALVTAPCSLAELSIMHADHVRRKLGHPARALALWLAGQARPRTRYFRQFQALRANGWRHNWATFRGTLRRVLAGANREPLR